MYYKGHGEVKVDTMLFLIANNCWTRSFALRYWSFYFSSVLFCLRWGKKTFAGKRLSQVSMYVAFFYPCPYWGQSIFVTVGSFIMLNQLDAGSIMMRHMKLRKNCPITVIFQKKCVWTAHIFHLSISSTIRNILFSGQSFYD